MKSFKEFLQDQAQKETIVEAKTKVEEWHSAVLKLIGQMEVWLRDADQDHILNIRETVHSIREEGLGTYQVPGLVIGLGERMVEVVPVARNVIGPIASTGTLHVLRTTGRVDMIGGGQRYLLFRFENEQGREDRWMIAEEDDYVLKNFDRPAFEASLQSMLG